MQGSPAARTLLPALLLLLAGRGGGVRAQQPPPPGSPAFSYPSAPGPQEDASIVVANRGLRVPFGRSVWLDPLSDLVLQVQPGDRCHLRVLDDDPLWLRPGRLIPQRFPCDFAPGEVTYWHLGSRSPSRDRVRLQLRYDSPSRAVVLPLALEVEVLFAQLEIVTRNLPLTVESLLGTSNALDGRSLEFAFQPGSQRCRVGALPGLGGLPRYGELLGQPAAPWHPSATGAPSPSVWWECEEFLRLGLRYRHSAAGRSPNRDSLPLVVELREAAGAGALLKREHFQVLVRIRAGAENTPPRPSFVAMLMMEVDQFVLTALTPDMLAAEDAESAPDLLLFNITSPFGPGQGHVVSTDDRSLPIAYFSQRDVRELRVAYQPPAEDSARERLFELELEVLDPEGAASEPFAFMIVVKPMNTLAPVVTRNTGLVLYEGQSRPLSSPGPSPSLLISDEDDLEQVRVSVLAGLRHGHLALLEEPQAGEPQARKHFTVAELAAGRVIYQHDGSESPLSDNLVLRLEDGGARHHVEFLFPITLVPTDDQPPLLNANTGLSLAEGDIAPIPARALSATDIDSDDATLRFVLESGPAAGQLLLRQAQPLVSEWLQQDIVEGRLFYRHLGPHSPGPRVVLDQFVFRVQDDNDPPNRSGPQSFMVRVHPVDRLAPVLHGGSSLRLVVAEQQVTPLRRKHLRYTDQDSGDREIHYTITQPPTDTDSNHPGGAKGTRLGFLVLTDDHSVEVMHFSQAQINHHKISYRPPQQELGVAPRLAQFQYRVEDAAGNAAQGTFTIYLQPIDNQPPEITNSGFTVHEGARHVLGLAELDASDTDTEPTHLQFTLTQAPQHGQLQLSGHSLAMGAAFGLEDIKHGRVVYVHSGTESHSDACSLDVSDGIHVVPITLKVTVHPVDDEVPTLRLPPGTLGSYLDVLENGAAEITTNVIQGTDEDTDDLMLTFIVEDPPQHGDILVQGMPAERFSQRDLLDGAVVYAHTGGEIGLLPKEDTFNLTLSDLSEEWSIGGNVVRGVSVLVTILPVDSQAPEVFVGEHLMVVEGDKRVITHAHLRTEDVDTPSDDILCTIVAQPTSGYVENISPALGSEKSRAGTAISAFTLKDVRQGHIYYVQSIHKGVEPVEDRFTFRCSDGINFSERHFFPIVIIPTNDEEPEIFMREFVVMEGMSLVIDTPILNAADGDIPADELTFTITKFPTHGHLVNQLINGTVLVESFTLAQITESSSIIYEHDDSETKEDSFEVKLTDGKHAVEKTVLIMVIPVDDETPRMTINDGLEIEIGETKIIHNRILKATDLDSEDKTLTYIIRYVPVHGQLMFNNTKPVTSFTKQDLNENLISCGITSLSQKGCIIYPLGSFQYYVIS
uniref:FRAS1-related extracellular matrix protein 2 n=1 Tax=Terrapene triunguis TaxID=2587831 RepID=A0A674K9Q8_9SAUR